MLSFFEPVMKIAGFFCCLFKKKFYICTCIVRAGSIHKKIFLKSSQK